MRTGGSEAAAAYSPSRRDGNVLSYPNRDGHTDCYHDSDAPPNLNADGHTHHHHTNTLAHIAADEHPCTHSHFHMLSHPTAHAYACTTPCAIANHRPGQCLAVVPLMRLVA